MEMQWVYISTTTFFTCYLFLNMFVRKFNNWYYYLKHRNKEYPLPYGDMGWPLIGNLLTFFNDFSSGQPDSFITNLHLKYGKKGIYKTHLFGNPSIIICEPKMCKKVLTDDENFKYGYPKSIMALTDSKLNHVSTSERKHFRRLITAPIVGHKAMEMYLERIEDIVINSLEELSSMKHPIELLKEMKNVSFKTIVHVFMGSSNDQDIIKTLGSLSNDLFHGFFSIAIDAPGFAFNKALKSRKKFTETVQPLVDKRRLMIKNGQQVGEKKDLIDILLELKVENGTKLEDEEISDLLIALLVAGHKSTATGLMWSIIYLTQHPHMLKKAKEEQEEILRTRPTSQKQLSLIEVKQMVYLSQVINEMLRCTSMSFSTFREATTDVIINGYLIPKGWRVLTWLRAFHMDSEYFPNAEEFNPSRWDDQIVKAGTFLPFGVGSRLCPGADLAKLEISVFLHYFLLNYRLEQINPNCPITCLPVSTPIDNCLAKKKQRIKSCNRVKRFTICIDGDELCSDKMDLQHTEDGFRETLLTTNISSLVV